MEGERSSNLQLFFFLATEDSRGLLIVMQLLREVFRMQVSDFLFLVLTSHLVSWRISGWNFLMFVSLLCDLPEGCMHNTTEVRLNKQGLVGVSRPFCKGPEG
jgi:hypothetical protein